MSKFNFKYKKILDIRMKKEDQVKQELSRAYSALESERLALDRLNQVLEQLIIECRKEVALGCSCYELRVKNDYISYTRDKIKYQEGVIEKWLDRVEKVKTDLLEAMKERKIFEKLKEKMYEEYREAEKKAEEATIDQIVTYKNSTL